MLALGWEPSCPEAFVYFLVEELLFHLQPVQLVDGPNAQHALFESE